MSQNQKSKDFLENLFNNNASSSYVSGAMDMARNLNAISQTEYDEYENRRLSELNDD